MVKNQSGFKVKIVRIDNGTKYINNRFRKLFRDTGVVYKLIAVYTPEQNGLSEVQNRIVLNGVRIMISDSRLTKFL